MKDTLARIIELEAQLAAVRANLPASTPAPTPSAELAAAKSRITELEQEVAETLEAANQWESRCESTQAQLQAVTQERDKLKQARITCDHCTAGFNGRHEVFCQIYAYAEEKKQLQAHNKVMGEALEMLLGNERCPAWADKIIRSALRTEVPKP